MENLAADPASTQTSPPASSTRAAITTTRACTAATTCPNSDQRIAEGRMARALAETGAAHAKPGSPAATANGDIDDHGPQATTAVVVGANQIQVRFSFDAARAVCAGC